MITKTFMKEGVTEASCYHELWEGIFAELLTCMREQHSESDTTLLGHEPAVRLEDLNVSEFGTQFFGLACIVKF